MLLAIDLVLQLELVHVVDDDLVLIGDGLVVADTVELVVELVVALVALVVALIMAIVLLCIPIVLVAILLKAHDVEPHRLFVCVLAYGAHNDDVTPVRLDCL